MFLKILRPISLLLCALTIYAVNANSTFKGSMVSAATNEQSLTSIPTATPVPDTIYGDVSGDGIVDSADYTYIRKYLLGISTLPASNWKDIGDLNIDGIIDTADYTYLRRYLLGLISILPVANTYTNKNAFPDWDKVHTGYATFTGSGYTGGTALLDPISPDMEITALNNNDYYFSYGVEAALAGAYLEVTGEKGSTIVYVCDLYPEGGQGALDLCPTSFNKIGDMSKGKIDISWRIIQAPITGNVSYRIKEGSTRDWLAIQVRNHLYPVLKMEYYKDGQWVNMKKMFWNHFIGEQIPTTTPMIRMTDIRGNVITDVVQSIPDVNEPGSEAYIVPGNVQFPQ